MPDYPPFMNAYGAIGGILDKVKSAKTPDRFTYDFLATTLGYKSSSARAFIPLAKRIGFLNSDATPTELYKAFRNEGQSKAAMAKAIKVGFGLLYERNEKAHVLGKKELEGLLVQITGLEPSNSTIRAIIGTFEALKALADFAEKPLEKGEMAGKAELEIPQGSGPEVEGLGLNLSYSINLVLPKTDDVAVFNAIFKSLKENLLKK